MTESQTPTDDMDLDHEVRVLSELMRQAVLLAETITSRGGDAPYADQMNAAADAIAGAADTMQAIEDAIDGDAAETAEPESDQVDDTTDSDETAE